MIKYILKFIEEHNKAMCDLGYPVGYSFLCVYTGYVPLFPIEDVVKKDEKNSL